MATVHIPQLEPVRLGHRLPTSHSVPSPDQTSTQSDQDYAEWLEGGGTMEVIWSSFSPVILVQGRKVLDSILEQLFGRKSRWFHLNLLYRILHYNMASPALGQQPVSQPKSRLPWKAFFNLLGVTKEL